MCKTLCKNNSLCSHKRVFLRKGLPFAQRCERIFGDDGVPAKRGNLRRKGPPGRAEDTTKIAYMQILSNFFVRNRIYSILLDNQRRRTCLHDVDSLIGE